jgi:hypothetical protein
MHINAIDQNINCASSTGNGCSNVTMMHYLAYNGNKYGLFPFSLTIMLLALN